jgi:hypothetical protein
MGERTTSLTVDDTGHESRYRPARAVGSRAPGRPGLCGPERWVWNQSGWSLYGSSGRHRRVPDRLAVPASRADRRPAESPLDDGVFRPVPDGSRRRRTGTRTVATAVDPPATEPTTTTSLD